MRSFRSIVGASWRILSSRLDHLQETLESLTERIRAAVAKEIGENVGEVVCQTLRQILKSTSATPRPYDSYRDDAWEDRFERWSRWYEEEQPSYRNYRSARPDLDDLCSADDNQSLARRPPDRNRLVTAVTAGLRAAAWWIRHSRVRFSVWGVAAAGLIAGGTSFALAGVASAGLTILETTDQISTLKKPLR